MPSYKGLWSKRHLPPCSLSCMEISGESEQHVDWLSAHSLLYEIGVQPYAGLVVITELAPDFLSLISAEYVV